MNQSLNAQSLSDALLAALATVAQTILSFVPQLIAALLILALGIIVSKWIKTGVIGFLQALNIEGIISNTRFEKFLKHANISNKAGDLIGEIAYWLVMVVFLITAINTLGLTTVSAFLTSLLTYLPRLFSALIIFIIGIIAAGLVENLVKSVVTGINLATARLLAKIASYTIVVFAGLIALSEIGIAKSFIQTLFIGIVAMLALAFGLAFGLGAKDLVKEVLGDWYKNTKQKTRL